MVRYIIIMIFVFDCRNRGGSVMVLASDTTPMLATVTIWSIEAVVKAMVGKEGLFYLVLNLKR